MPASGSGSSGNFLWIIKSSLLFNTSKKLFASFAGHITSSASNYSLSGKPNRCDYTPLTPVEPNNNSSSNNNNNNNNNGGSKHADSRRHCKSGRTGDEDFEEDDDDDDASSTDSSDEDSDDSGGSSSSSDDDEDGDEETDQLDRLTCIVCERAFSSTRILDRHKIRERHFGCGTCDAIFPNQMALEAHREEADHWSSDEDDDDDDDDDDDHYGGGGDDDGHDFRDEKHRKRPFVYDHDSPLDTEDEIELDRKDAQLQKDRLFLI